MNKRILLLLAATTLFSCDGQAKAQDMEIYPETTGVGTLGIAFFEPVSFFRNEADSTAFGKVSFRWSKWKRAWISRVKGVSTFAPLGMMDDISKTFGGEDLNPSEYPPRCEFRVLEVDEAFYRVVVDEESFATALIPREHDENKWLYRYDPWEKQLAQAYFIELMFWNRKLYDAPDGNPIYEDTELQSWKVTDISGDWIRLKQMERGYVVDDGVEGWVRWRTEGTKRLSVNIIDILYE
jgi:hypothetical protein